MLLVGIVIKEGEIVIEKGVHSHNAGRHISQFHETKVEESENNLPKTSRSSKCHQLHSIIK